MTNDDDDDDDDDNHLIKANLHFAGKEEEMTSAMILWHKSAVYPHYF